MTIDHDEHYYFCDECEGTGMMRVPANPDMTAWTDGFCSNCGDGMSKGLGVTEGDAEDCEDNPCDVATGQMTL